MRSRSARSTLARRVVYPLKDRAVGRRTLQTLAWMRATEGLSSVQLEEVQRRRLQATLRHAGRHVPYYRDLFARLGIAADELEDAVSVARLPLLDKATVRGRGAEMVATDRGRRGAQRVYTSGTSGEPAAVLCDPRGMAHHLAAQLRGRAWHGIEIGAPELRVWHAPRLYVTSSMRARAFWRANAVKDGLLNVRMAPAADLSEESMRSWESSVLSARATVIYGYASAIYEFARYLRDEGRDPETWPVSKVILTAERIHPRQRTLIAEAMGADVLDEYGSSECGIIAFECEAGGLHVSEENVLLESVDSGDGPEAVITTLANDLMPLIRYRVGDLIEWGSGSCGCGRGLRLLKRVSGRTADVLVASDGKRVHAFRLMLLLQRIEGIGQYQLIQRRDGGVDLLVRGDRALTSDERTAIYAAFAEALGSANPLRIHSVGSITQGPVGKHRFLISEMESGEASG